MQSIDLPLPPLAAALERLRRPRPPTLADGPDFLRVLPEPALAPGPVSVPGECAPAPMTPMRASDRRVYWFDL